MNFNLILYVILIYMSDTTIIDSELQKKLDDNKNNGLITKIWGEHMWESIHCIAFGYPVEPTCEQKEQYKDFFIQITKKIN